MAVLEGGNETLAVSPAVTKSRKHQPNISKGAAMGEGKSSERKTSGIHSVQFELKCAVYNLQYNLRKGERLRNEMIEYATRGLDTKKAEDILAFIKILSVYQDEKF